MADLEPCQQQLADISSRVWIRWGNGEPYENTSTLVLTAPSQTFLDVRVIKPPLQPAVGTVEHSIDTSRLEWAFSGIATTEYREGICHKTWTHHIDSRSAYGAEPPIDEGDMFPESDGVLCREKGSMINPETGKMSEYEEMWESVEPHATGTDTGKWCLVATVASEEHKARGMLIRVGQFVQCLLIVNDEVNVERWVYTDAGSSGDDHLKGWACTVKLGSHVLPCARLFKVEEQKKGIRLQEGTQPWVWIVTEKVSW
ncbi:hypothetical protein C8Q72DRAFT_205859 [Fomitopsis betulina]|nr:hypothetical protein C8Q72DRAFT_205859 [Fomitopsis betulina]